MSNRPGRNDPCPCGSGKKYKRCCLTSDEAAAREHARQQTLFDHAYGAPEFDANDDDGGELDDGEELFDIEDVPALDVRAITRLCYTRGVVRKLSDLRSGRV